MNSSEGFFITSQQLGVNDIKQNCTLTDIKVKQPCDYILPIVTW